MVECLFTEVEAQRVIDWADLLDDGVAQGYFKPEIIEVFNDQIDNWGQTGISAFTNFFVSGCYNHLFNF